MQIFAIKFSQGISYLKILQQVNTYHQDYGLLPKLILSGKQVQATS